MTTETICVCGKEKGWDEEVCEACRQKDRKLFIGSSEIAAVMGLSRWCTPLQLWALKSGKVQPDDLSEVEYVHLGTELEDWVAKKFERESGMKVRRAPKIYHHKDYPHYRAQVDRLVVNTGYHQTDALLECKTCSAWKAKEWGGEEIPQEYILQVMWQLGITGRADGHIAVLIGGQSFKHKKIAFDQSLFDKMISCANDFWQMVLDGTPPMVMGDDNPFMVELYPTDDNKMQQVDELNDRIAMLMQTKGSIKALHEEQDKLEAEIKAVIGDSMGIKTKEYTVTWKAQASSRVDTEKLKADSLYEKYLKQTQTRVLRVKKQGERNGDS